jgi:DNA-binding XRE family transcriptional regulator
VPRPELTDAERRRGLRLAAAIKSRRKRAEKTQEALAAAAGVRLDTLRALENRRTPTPNVFLIRDIAQALDVTVEELLK